MAVEPKKICSPLNYLNLSHFTEGADLPATAINDKGENVIVTTEPSDMGMCYRLDTYQKNGYVRINRYYEDGSWDETYGGR